MTEFDDDQRRRADPQQVGDLIDVVLARIGGGRKPDLLEIRERWDDIAGRQWSDRCRPVKVAGGTLIVEVADGATASLLRYEIDHLLRRLGELVPAVEASKIRLRVAARPWS